jgi:hypothetical protein
LAFICLKQQHIQHRINQHRIIRSPKIGTVTYADGTHFDQFIAPDGSLFTFVQTNPGVVTAAFELRGTVKRVSD